MNFAIETLACYLGHPASSLLADAPFKDWAVEKTFEEDLEEPRNDYAFPRHSVEFICDGDDNVTTIFVFRDQSPSSDEGLLDLPFSMTRKQVIERMGYSLKERRENHRSDSRRVRSMGSL